MVNESSRFFNRDELCVTTPLKEALSLVENECYATTAIDIALTSYASGDKEGTGYGIEKAQKELQCSLQDETEACKLLKQAGLGL